MPYQPDSTDYRIMLQSGRLFDLAHPDSSLITVEDIAHGLAHTCRYAGQCDGFYSVAEHSVLVSEVVERSKLAALFHDSAEAFVGDMSAPLKRMLPQYQAIEKNIQRSIFERFRIEWPPPTEVKLAEYSVMVAEQRVLMPPGTNDWLRADIATAANVRIHRLEPTKAKLLFLRRYADLIRLDNCDGANFATNSQPYYPEAGCSDPTLL